ncbi:UNVERIFIED_CONTAM: hypothetical protein Slati_4463000 [Sesamum latifolium]|uniref:Endonuclease/exonuclease/phosphatase domain-containing protein n=1 Tax=Sesamum latifolium TaxID=2727402 RepID=A0AAW2SSX4_9LAMI
MELGVGSHPGLDIYAYYLRPCCAKLLDKGTSYPIRAMTVAQLFLAQHISKHIGDTSIMIQPSCARDYRDSSSPRTTPVLSEPGTRVIPIKSPRLSYDDPRNHVYYLIGIGLLTIRVRGAVFGTRRELWQSLGQVADMVDDEPWLVLGDFNTVANMSEVCGASGDIRVAIEDFQSCIIETGLITLPMQGELFMWQNCSNNRSLWKKLDRILVNDWWLNRWSKAYYISLMPRTSNHSPLV